MRCMRRVAQAFNHRLPSSPLFIVDASADQGPALRSPDLSLIVQDIPEHRASMVAVVGIVTMVCLKGPGT